MKKIIIFLFSIFLCFGFINVYAEADPVLLTDDNVVAVRNVALEHNAENNDNNLIVILGVTTSDTTWDYQDSLTFDYSIEELSQDDYATFFSNKPLPDGLNINITVINPLDYDDDPDGDYDDTALLVEFSGTIPSTFDITNYEDNLIEMTIPNEYINGSDVDLSLDIGNFSTGKYKITTNYTVTYDVQGHGSAPNSEKVLKNNKATKPSDPSEDNYNFLGWYKEATCDNVFDFDNELITSDITLYAKWQYIEPYTPPVIIDNPEPIYVPVKTCIN